MNRWVLLEHKLSLDNSVEIHYDFLVEGDLDCLTWKLLQIPILNEGFVAIVRQPNHRLVWLTRVEHELSENRGFVKRVDYGTFINVSLKSVSEDFQFILNGKLLNGLLEISRNFCRLTNNN